MNPTVTLDPAIASGLLEVAPLAVVVSITIGIVQLFKNIDAEAKYSRFYPLFSFVVGMILSLVIFHLDVAVALVTSLSASGTYEVTKRSLLGIESSSADKKE